MNRRRTPPTPMGRRFSGLFSGSLCNAAFARTANISTFLSCGSNLNCKDEKPIAKNYRHPTFSARRSTNTPCITNFLFSIISEM